MSFVSENLAGRFDAIHRAYELGGAVFNGKHSGAEYRATCPFHNDSNPSLDVNHENGAYVCRSCGAGGDAVDFYSKRLGITVENAIVELREKLAIPTNGGRPGSEPSVVGTQSWEIRDSVGALIAEHVRMDLSDGKKRFAWHRDGKTGLGGLPTASLPLYGSEKVKSWDGDAPIIMCEGEKAADALTERGFRALGTVTGAPAAPGAESLEVCRGRHVVLWRDHDEPGRKQRDTVARRLAGVAASVRILEWGEQEGDDAFDFFARGGTDEQLDRILADAHEWGGRQHDAPPREPCAPGKPRSAAVLTCLNTVKREKVTWLWPRRIPFGKITMFDGDPGLGKSTVCDDLTARITRARELPDGQPCEAGAVLVLSAEDGLADTIRPRIEEAGGDVARVIVLEAVKRPDGTLDLFSLTDDIEVLREAIRSIRPKLVRIDPFSAYVGSADSHKDQEIRRVMAPLASAAQEFGAAIVLVRHLNKTRSENALYRGGGSIGIIGAARSGLLFVKDPDDATGERRLIATNKSNLCKPGPTLVYSVKGSDQDPDTAVIAWESCTDPRTAEQLMGAAGETFEERSARGDARGFLRQYLADGPKPSTEVIDDAKKEGHTPRTIRRAYDDVGAKPTKDSFSGPWLWRLR